MCPRCGYVLPKKDATVSGYDSQSFLRHVHCLKYGKIVTHARASKDFIVNGLTTDVCVEP